MIGENKMNQETQTDTCNETRRNLLKKAYIAPAVVALGSMSIGTNLNARSSSSSSLNNDGGWCKTRIHQKDWNAAKAWHNNHKKSFTQTRDNFRYNSTHAATNAWNSEKYETGVDYWLANRDGSAWKW